MTRRPIGENELIVVLGLGPDGAGARLLSRISLRSWERLGLVEGMPFWAQIKGVSLADK